MLDVLFQHLFAHDPHTTTHSTQCRRDCGSGAIRPDIPLQPVGSETTSYTPYSEPQQTYGQCMFDFVAYFCRVFMHDTQCHLLTFLRITGDLKKRPCLISRFLVKPRARLHDSKASFLRKGSQSDAHVCFRYHQDYFLHFSVFPLLCSPRLEQ